MRYNFSLGPPAKTIIDGVHGSGECWRYDVHGMPAGETAYIDGSDGHWRVTHFAEDGRHELPGEYPTPDNALAALQQIFEHER